MDLHGCRVEHEVMRIPAPMLVLGAVVSTQSGQALGKLLSAQVGPAGAVGLRLGFAALVLLAAHRPRVCWRRLAAAAPFGVAIAGMNVIYLALPYLPLGVASTLQLLGPLALAVLTQRRLSS